VSASPQHRRHLLARALTEPSAAWLAPASRGIVSSHGGRRAESRRARSTGPPRRRRARAEGPGLRALKARYGEPDADEAAQAEGDVLMARRARHGSSGRERDLAVLASCRWGVLQVIVLYGIVIPCSRLGTHGDGTRWGREKPVDTVARTRHLLF